MIDFVARTTLKNNKEKELIANNKKSFDNVQEMLGDALLHIGVSADSYEAICNDALKQENYLGYILSWLNQENYIAYQNDSDNFHQVLQSLNTVAEKQILAPIPENIIPHINATTCEELLAHIAKHSDEYVYFIIDIGADERAIGLVKKEDGKKFTSSMRLVFSSLWYKFNYKIKVVGEEEADIKPLLAIALSILGVSEKSFEGIYSAAATSEDFFYEVYFILNMNNYFPYITNQCELKSFLAGLYGHNFDSEKLILSTISEDFLPIKEDAYFLSKQSDDIDGLYNLYSYFIICFGEGQVLVGLLDKGIAKHFLSAMHGIKMRLPKLNFKIALMGKISEDNLKDPLEYVAKTSRVKNIEAFYNGMLVNLICEEALHAVGEVGHEHFRTYKTYRWIVILSPKNIHSEKIEFVNKTFEKFQTSYGDCYYEKELDIHNDLGDFKYVFSNIINNVYDHDFRNCFEKLDERLKAIIRNEFVLYNNEVLLINKGENNELEFVFKNAIRQNHEGLTCDNGKYVIGNQALTTIGDR